MSYLKRNLTNKLNELLKYFPVMLVIGARQTGKSFPNYR